jgi:S-DNA-T family DNA segregation ATPase FtsK/SpoIIIE
MSRLAREKLLDIRPGEKAFYLVPVSPARYLVIFESLTVPDPDRLFNEDLLQRVSVDLGGVPVLGLRKNSFYYQIGTKPGKVARKDLASIKLDEAFGSQPTPLHVPLGMTSKGPAWRQIEKLDSVLIVGPRGSGKTTLMHAFIQALIRGGAALLYLWDNKAGNEFGRYSNLPNVTVAINQQLDQSDKLAETLQNIANLLNERAGIYSKYGGSPTLEAHNLKAVQDDKLKPVVLLIDEIYFMPLEIREKLTQLVTLGRAYGLYPVLGCQRADRTCINGQLDANMTSRMVFRVPDANESRLAIGRSGAESLPNTKGRYLFFDGTDLIQVQGFNVNLPAVVRTPASGRPSLCLLAPEEVAMVEAALKMHGYFKISGVSEAVRRNPKYISKFSATWAANGWLTEIQSSNETPPRRLGRRVTKTLARMAGLDGKYPDLVSELPEKAADTVSAGEENE